ncbi:hypothetical protein D3C80_1316580 [compost metagenome]
MFGLEQQAIETQVLRGERQGVLPAELAFIAGVIGKRHFEGDNADLLCGFQGDRGEAGPLHRRLRLGITQLDRHDVKTLGVEPKTHHAFAVFYRLIRPGRFGQRRRRKSDNAVGGQLAKQGGNILLLDQQIALRHAIAVADVVADLAGDLIDGMDVTQRITDQ